MKIVAERLHFIIIDADDRWMTYDLIEQSIVDFAFKEKYPNWFNAQIAKWGFVLLDEPVDIESIEDITVEPGELGMDEADFNEQRKQAQMKEAMRSLKKNLNELMTTMEK